MAVTVVQFNRLQRRLGQVAPIRQEVQFVEHLRDVDRPHLLGQHTHGAERARLTHVQFPLLRCVHHDGNHCGVGIALDGLHRLQAVHAGHLVIHEDGVGPVTGEIIERLLGGFGHVDFDVVFLEHAAQDHAGGFGIVHHECAFTGHRTIVTQSARPQHGGPGRTRHRGRPVGSPSESVS
jgi:hypothetical protein